MIRAFRSEWVKLRRPRMLLGGLGGLSVVAALLTTVSIVAAGGGTPRAQLTVAQLAGADGLARAVQGASTILGAVALSIAAASVAGEFTHGTLRVLLVREPRRLRLMAGKHLALASFVALGVVVAAGLAATAAVVAAAAKSVPTGAWWSGAGVWATARTALNLVLAVCGYSFAGATLALLVRSPAIAIGAGLAWLLPVEAILAAVDGADAVLPGQLLSSLASGGDHTSYLTAGATLAAYGIVALVASSIVFARRDVAT